MPQHGASTAVHWYDSHAAERSRHYESLDPSSVHAWLLDLLPPTAGVAVDVGAGTGRDAAWLASMGHRAFAVEPSSAMRTVAADLRPHSGVTWVDDALPDLTTVRGTGTEADIVLLSAVWMHVPPGDRARAMFSLSRLLRPGGLLALTLRVAPADAVRGMHPVSGAEVEALANGEGLHLVRRVSEHDHLERADVRWEYLAFVRHG